MTAELRAELDPYLRRVPSFAGVLDHPLTITRLAGLTNVNFLIGHRDGSSVLRIPGDGTAEYIDRVAEAAAARSAADAGVNAPLEFFDPADGLMVTTFLEGAVTMSGPRFADPTTGLGAVERAAVAFRRLHENAVPFAVDFRLFAMIDEYKALLAGKGATLPAGYDDVQAFAESARHALESRPAARVPSHCDPLCENFLDTGERMFIIDYEYAGNNDPMWDLGDLSVEGAFTAEQDAVLLRAYFGGEPPRDQIGRMVLHKALCDLLWTLWGVIQHVNGNTAEDFWAYATNRFERCRRLMSSPAFADHIDAVTS
ncbi:MAG: choline kinase family protein [Ilumatobacteraceae bacterium]